MFGRGRKNQETAPSRSAEPARFEQSGNPEQEKEQAQLEKHKNKLMQVIKTGDASRFAKAPAEMSDYERDEILDRISSGDVDSEAESEMLQQIVRPVDKVGTKAMYEDTVMPNRHFSRILAYSTDVGFNNIGGLTKDSLDSFISDYPTPVEFAPIRAKLMRDIERSQSPSKTAEYRRDIAAFEKQIYGKQSEYHDAMTSLRADAAEYSRHNRVASRRENTETFGTTVEQEVSAADRFHQDKIIRVVLSGDPNYLTDPNPDVSTKDRETMLGRMAFGGFTESHERGFLAQIARPIDKKGINRVYTDSLQNDKHLRRILAYSTGAGFNGQDRVSARTLNSFAQLYPTPTDFQGFKNRMLGEIKQSNTPAKYEEYVASMEEFEHSVYGKQKEYFDAIQQLRAEAAEHFGTSETSSEDAKRFDEAYDEHAERRGEQLIADAGHFEMSRAQARNNIRVPFGEVLDTSESQDTALVVPERGTFGVFDGVGGSENGRGASRMAAAAIDKLDQSYALQSGEHLAWALSEANNAILGSEIAGQGQTTGILVKITEQNGQRMLSYASVGDSRLYLIAPNGRAEMVTHDEGEGRYITNAIGHSSCNVKQFGDIPLHDGYRIMLCSDGITGDRPEEAMSEDTIGRIVSHSRNDREAAYNLAMSAMKNDDRTAVVFTPQPIVRGGRSPRGRMPVGR